MPSVAVVRDITYIKVRSKWIYLSVFTDLLSRKVVGWNLDESLSVDSICRVFSEYLYRNNNPKGVLVHSNRGIQYASEQRRSLLKS